MKRKENKTEETRNVLSSASEFQEILQEKGEIPAELSDALMSMISGGHAVGHPGDIRKDVSAELTHEEYAAGDWSDMDGWDD